MESLASLLRRARQEGWAVGHFNASESDHFRAIVEACAAARAPAMVGTSEGERLHLGLSAAVALRDAFRAEFNLPVFLNADHTRSVVAAKAAVDSGYDSIHIDLSALPFAENTAGTREVVDYAEARKEEINVEGELGYLRGESRVHTEVVPVSPADYTDPSAAEEFVRKTGVKRLAVAVGNVHGLSPREPGLDIARLKAIRAVLPDEVALVLHAASGVPSGEILSAIEAGVANIHINTDLRVAYASSLKANLSPEASSEAAYKFDLPAREAMKAVVAQKLALFGARERLS